MTAEAKAVKQIAVVGGGFSGTLVLANLVDRVPAGTIITVFEASGIFGLGLAYATSNPGHLLNVPAGRMGAFAPDHFLQWLLTEEGAAAVALVCPGVVPDANSFLPRVLYGLYLKHILAAALERAPTRGVVVNLVCGWVTRAHKDAKIAGIHLRVETKGHRNKQVCDALVLATGNRSPRRVEISPWAYRSRDYVADPWGALETPQLASELKRLSRWRTAVILGCGLTAVDIALSLERLGFKGKTIALSRHGLLPSIHSVRPQAPWTWRIPPTDVAPTAVAVFRWLKNETRAAGEVWRSVVDALRPLTPQLWQRLPAVEQRRLLRRHTLWSIHRHRMAPEIAAILAQLRSAGRFEVVAAQEIVAMRGLAGLRVRFRRRYATTPETIKAARVFNGTGPDYRLQSDGLLHWLDAHALVQPEANRLGLVLNGDGSVRSAFGRQLFAIGAPLFGSLFETTAVPELREQARLVAECVTAAIAG